VPDSNPYKEAYKRERLARERAEVLLDDKTRSLYNNVIKLQASVEQLKEAQDKLIQSEKMASIGLLAAGVAHEINNPIGFCLSNMKMLEEYLESILKLDALVLENLSNQTDSVLFEKYQQVRAKEDIEFVVGELKELLTDTSEGLNRVSSIVKNLTKVSHAGNSKQTLCDINETIMDSLKVVWAELKYNMEVEKSFAQLPKIYCNGSEIHQVLMNLFINASYASEQHGLLIIKTYRQLFKKQNFVVIEIKDNGKGMSPEVRSKIFDPFFTTKPVGIGTGLGLSVSFGIIKKHHGEIDVTSKEGEGTTFTIKLPEDMRKN
jgi:two-component system NtrC family sensor kinase